MRENRVYIKKEGARWEIPGIFTWPDNGEGKYPAMLLIHGHLAYKEGDGYLYSKLAAVLAERGIASLRIDLTSMGENRNDRKNYTIPNLLSDVSTAYRYMLECEHITAEKVGLIGHSLGGKLVSLSAGLNPFCIATLNGALFERNPGKDKGDIPMFQNSFTGDEFTVVACSDGRHELLYKDFELSQSGYSVEEAVKNYQRPFIVVVGMNDPTVSPQVSLNFYDRYDNPEKRLIKIEEANHTFNAKTGDYTKVYEMSNKLADVLSGLMK